MSSPAPKSPEQSEKAKKYDRQLRLWGDHGQKALENSSVCLINATALGTEILKSLILPGIGSFTIIDVERITEDDIDSNFFMESDSFGMSRAQVTTQYLLELNSDVKGDYIDESPEHILNQSDDFFNKFSVVIAASLSNKILTPISKHLWEKDVPFLVSHSLGFIGYIRLQIKEHTIIEAHPDNENPDLRILEPWQALRDHLETIDLENLDKKTRSHVPPVTILYYYLKKYSEQYSEYPKTKQERHILKDLIINGCRDENGLSQLEENFKEAIHFINTSLHPCIVPQRIKELLEDNSCVNLHQNSSPFWIMCAALRDFVHSEGCLPLKGNLPDMVADTNSYIQLQKLYQTRAQSQVETVYRRACQISRNLGLTQDYVNEQEVKLFCKHANEVSIFRGTCIADECVHVPAQVDFASYLENSDGLMCNYIVMRAVERFMAEFNTYPGHNEDHVEPDVVKLKSIVAKMLSEWGYNNVIREEKLHEVCTYGGAELHSVSAFLGGCVAQEAIKLITHQYKPLANTFVYDAITSNSSTFVL